jgi:hypothetical protein
MLLLLLLLLLHMHVSFHRTLQRLLGMQGKAPAAAATASTDAASAAVAADPEAVEATDSSQVRPNQARPLNPQQFHHKAGFWLAADAADSLPAAVAEALRSNSSSDADAAAEAALAGAEVAYLFTPLQQQQQQQQGVRIDWQAVSTSAEGLQPAAALCASNPKQTNCTQAGTAAAAAAVVEVPGAVTARDVLQAERQLQDRVLLAGHSSMVYRCIGVSSSMTPSTSEDFTWPAKPAAAAAAGESNVAETAAAAEAGSGHAAHSASSHAEYFKLRYGVSGFRDDLPMLQVAGQGWRKGLGLLAKPLKPAQLQKVAGRSALAMPEDLTAPEAAAAAVAFGGLQQQRQQQGEGRQLTRPTEQQLMPGSKRPFGLVSNSNEPAAVAEFGTSGSGGSVAAAAAARVTNTTEAMEVDMPGLHHQQQQGEQQQQQAYLPLELCWLLPLTATEWSQLQLLPVFMHRINTMLRASRMQQHLAQIAANHVTNSSTLLGHEDAVDHIKSSSSSSGVAKGFAVPPLPLLVVSLTGAAAGEAYDLEGLEFLGDVVLKLLATNYVLQVRIFA